MLRVENLSVEVKGLKVLDAINLSLEQGESCALMGPNGSGKSSFCFALMGHPNYKVTGGKILFNGLDITNLPPEERARQGLFLGFQQPQEIAGMTMGNFLRQISSHKKNETPNKVHIGPAEFYPKAKKLLEEVGLAEHFVGRGVNAGFSGGEKKRAELAQMSALEPRLSLLDEIDSGLDVDALKSVADMVSRMRKEKQMGLILVTHYQRLLHYVPVDKVCLLVKGRMVACEGPELALEIERTGFNKWL